MRRVRNPLWRFWSMVDVRRVDDCWMWQGCRNPSGHGRFSLRGKRMQAHVLSWQMANGQPRPNDMGILHKCNVSSCVNPRHLYPGTQKQNSLDARNAYRTYWKIGPRAVPVIRFAEARGATVSHLAKLWNVDRKAIRQVRDRDTYNWVREAA